MAPMSLTAMRDAGGTLALTHCPRWTCMALMFWTPQRVAVGGARGAGPARSRSTAAMGTRAPRERPEHHGHEQEGERQEMDGIAALLEARDRDTGQTTPSPRGCAMRARLRTPSARPCRRQASQMPGTRASGRSQLSVRSQRTQARTNSQGRPIRSRPQGSGTPASQPRRPPSTLAAAVAGSGTADSGDVEPDGGGAARRR